MDGTGDRATSWRNREHYFKAALIGGGTSILLSMIPVLNWLNLFFFFLVMVGGGAGTYWVQKKTGTVDAMEGAVIGALGGVAAGVFYMVIGFCGASAASLILVPDMRSSQVGEFMAVIGIVMSTMCGLSFVIYPMMSGLGGLLSATIWPPTDAGGAALPGAAPGVKAAPTEAQILKRKKLLRVVLGTLSGCLLLMGLFCGLAGYLAILENRDPDDTAGEEEIVSMPVVLGERMVVEIEATDSDHVRYGIWLVADDDLPSSMYSLDGSIGCRQNYGYDPGRYGRGREPYTHDFYVYRGPDEGEPEWLFLDSEFSYGGDGVTCYVQVDELPAGVSNARIVVTKLTRPSDWF